MSFLNFWRNRINNKAVYRVETVHSYYEHGYYDDAIQTLNEYGQILSMERNLKEGLIIAKVKILIAEPKTDHTNKQQPTR